MAEISTRKRVWGWWFFDWASQPYHTLLVTFIFGPYFASVAAEHFLSTGLDTQAAAARAQTVWSWCLTITGLIIGFGAPLIGALADVTGRRIPWIFGFSIMYVVGSGLLWYTMPDGSNMWWMLSAFGLGFVGAEYALIFINSQLPDIGEEEDVGKISGSGFAFGYFGGLVSLAIMLALFVEQPNGKTLIGLDPAFGLDAGAREGTRFVGLLTAAWYVLFMIPYFMWVRDADPTGKPGGLSQALKMLGKAVKRVLSRSSLAAYLGSSMLYRDALNGLYGFGGVYATLVLEWNIVKIGVFGIISVLAAAVFAWLGGKADKKYGPKPVIKSSIWVLILVCATIVGMDRTQIFGIPPGRGINAPGSDFLWLWCPDRWHGRNLASVQPVDDGASFRPRSTHGKLWSLWFVGSGDGLPGPGLDCDHDHSDGQRALGGFPCGGIVYSGSDPVDLGKSRRGPDLVRMLRVVSVIACAIGLALPAVAEPLAKQLFGAMDTGSRQRPSAFGSYSKGCASGLVQLPETGPTWQAMRLSRNRNWGHPETIDFIEKLSRSAAKQRGWSGLYIGDISQPRGGPMLTGHRSHQIGLDIDIWMLPANNLRMSRQQRESISSISLRRNKGAFVNRNWTRQHHEIIKAAAKDKRTARIFVFPGAKVQMCNDEKGNRSYLRKIRPWYGHHYHFHVRLKCPRNAKGCVNQDPPPKGDGCAEAQTWVNNIISPPPPTPRDPNAPPPKKRREYVLADLPSQCVSVLQSQ